MAYFAAWGGSIFLLAYSIFIYQKEDGGIKFFKPIILAQGLFWVYTAVTSIFYFLDTMGFVFFDQVRYPDYNEIILLSKAQVHILLGHTAYLIGFFLYTKKPGKQEYAVHIKHYDYLKMSIFATLFSVLLLSTPFAQLSSYLNIFSTICAVKFFGESLKTKKSILPSVIYFGIVMGIGLISGMKEGTLLPLIFLGVVLYDYFGIMKTSIFAIPIFSLYFYFVPTINSQIRYLSWDQQKGALETLSNINDDAVFTTENITNNNWAFFTQRLSEISMFTKYMQSVPDRRPYYDSEIFFQGLKSLIPRFLWPGKPSPDVTAQRRAVENGAIIINAGDTSTSAKPQTMADAYLSHGYLGILITFLVFGFITNSAAVLLESKFGYNLGITILFYSLFLVLTKGGCFENLFSVVLYGYILFYLIKYIFEKFSLTVRI